MANTVSANLAIFAQGALSEFAKILAPVTTFSRSFSPQEGQVGQAVVVPLYNSAGTADSFTSQYVVSDQTIGSVTVNLNQHFYKAVAATDKEVAQQGVDLAKLGAMAGRAVATSVTTGALSLINTGTYGLPVQTLGNANNFAASGVLAARTKSAVWGSERNAIIDSAYYTSLLGNLPNSDMIQTNAALDGSLGKLYGFSLYESNVSPLAGTTNTKAIFASPDAIAIASRTLAPDDLGTVEFTVVQDPQTNITLSARSYYEQDKARRVYVVDWLGGYSVGNTGAATVILGG